MGTEFRLTLCVNYDTVVNRDAAVTALKTAILSVGDKVGIINKAAGVKTAEIIKDSYQVSDPIITGRESLAII